MPRKTTFENWSETLFEEDHLVHALLALIPDAVIVSNQKGEIIYCNAHATEILGYTEKEFLQLRIEDLVPKERRHVHTRYRKQYASNPKTRHLGSTMTELFATHKDGHVVPVDISLSPLTTSTGVIVLSVLRDITERKRAQDQLHRLNHQLNEIARFDTVTQLPNRYQFEETLSAELSRAKRHDHSFAVFFIDLDKFKPVNDTLGHDMGDLLLKQVADRVSAFIRKEDLFARIGGDEFAIIMTDIKHHDDALVLAKKVLDSIRKPYSLQEHNATISASIGIACYPDHGDTQKQLLRHADNAMYFVKQNGRNNLSFYHDDN